MPLNIKKIGTSNKYKNVYLYDFGNKQMWCGSCYGASKYFDKETDAAKYVDLRRIEKGKEPINILKRK